MKIAGRTAMLFLGAFLAGGLATAGMILGIQKGYRSLAELRPRSTASTTGQTTIRAPSFASDSDGAVSAAGAPLPTESERSFESAPRALDRPNFNGPTADRGEATVRAPIVPFIPSRRPFVRNDFVPDLAQNDAPAPTTAAPTFSTVSMVLPQGGIASAPARSLPPVSRPLSQTVAAAPSSSPSISPPSSVSPPPPVTNSPAQRPIAAVEPVPQTPSPEAAKTIASPLPPGPSAPSKPTASQATSADPPKAALQKSIVVATNLGPGGTFGSNTDPAGIHADLEGIAASYKAGLKAYSLVSEKGSSLSCGETLRPNHSGNIIGAIAPQLDSGLPPVSLLIIDLGSSPQTVPCDSDQLSGLSSGVQTVSLKNNQSWSLKPTTAAGNYIALFLAGPDDLTDSDLFPKNDPVNLANLGAYLPYLGTFRYEPLLKVDEKQNADTKTEIK